MPLLAFADSNTTSAVQAVAAGAPRMWIPMSQISIPLVALLVLMVLLWLTGKVPVRYNVRNLQVRWWTTAMTALAFTLVIALMTVMLAFVNGMYQVTSQSGRPDNVFVLSQDATDELFSNLLPADIGDVEREPGVSVRADGQPLATKEVYLVVNQPIPAPEGAKARRRFVQVRGIEDPQIAGEVHGMTLADGSWFSPPGVRFVAGTQLADSTGAVALPASALTDEVAQASPPSEGTAPRTPAIEAVLGNGLAAEMATDRPGGKPLQAGDTFALGGRVWIVAGVMAPSGTTFDSEVWAKRSLVGPMFGKNNFSTIVLKAADEAAAKKLAVDLSKSYTKASLGAKWEPEYFSKLAETSKQFLIAIVAVAVVMGLGGVFGVMNTMFAAIAQRAKDIAVLRILGFGRGQVLCSFLLESLVIALIGGLFGCALGFLCDGWTAKSIVSSGQSSKTVILRLIVDGNILGAGLLLSLLMGLVGGLFPALTSIRVRPLETLR